MKFDDSLTRRVKHLTKFKKKGKVTFQQLAGDGSVFKVLGGLPGAQIGWASRHLGDDSKIFKRRGEDGGEERVMRINLKVAGSARGYAEFEVEAENGGFVKYELKVRVSGGTAGESVPVILGDVTLGAVTFNSQGQGYIKFSNRPGNGEVKFPAGFNFKTVDAGTVLQVGNLVSGALGKGTPGGDTLAKEISFKALATGGGAEAEFEFEIEQEADRDEKRKLVVKVRDLDSDSSYEVLVGGVNVGTIKTDDRGRGELYLTNRVRKSDQQPLPAGFPNISEGTKVEIVGTSLDSKFGKPNTVNHNTGATGTVREWEAKLRGDSLFRGKAKFEIEREDGGVLEQKLVVDVVRGAANSSYVVKVDGVKVGDVTTNGAGKGRLILSSIADSRKELPLPTNLPSIGGARVDVGGKIGGFLRLDNNETSRMRQAIGDDSSRRQRLGGDDRGGWLAGG